MKKFVDLDQLIGIGSALPARTRSNRVRRIFRSATRAASSYDIQSARYRPVSLSRAKSPLPYCASKSRIGSNESRYPRRIARLDNRPGARSRAAEQRGWVAGNHAPHARPTLSGGVRLRADGRFRRCLSSRFASRSISSGKRSKARFHSHAATPDRFFKLVAPKRQSVGRGKSAEQRGTDHAALLFSQAREITMHKAFRRGVCQPL